jgi:hypothetical protein
MVRHEATNSGRRVSESARSIWRKAESLSAQTQNPENERSRGNKWKIPPLDLRGVPFVQLNPFCFLCRHPCSVTSGARFSSTVYTCVRKMIEWNLRLQETSDRTSYQLSGWQSWFLFGILRIKTRRPAILTEVSSGVPQFLYANA